MGCLIVILIIAGILTLPSIFGPLIFWSLAAILCYLSQNSKQQAHELSGQAKQLREQAQQHRELLKAVNPQAYEELVQREAEEAAKAQEDRKAANKQVLYACLAIFGVFVLICVIVAIANIGKNSASSTSMAKPEATAVVAASMPSWATPTPEPSATENQTEVRRAIPVIASPTSTPYAEIPSPTDEEAIAAFNALQDQLGRPHIDRLYYTGSTDSYNWTGPKNHKRMSMKRRQFNIEIWRPYWMKNHANSKASPSSETTPTSGNKTEDEILAQQWKEIEKNPNMHYPAQDAKPSPTETYVPEQPEYYMMPDNKPESERSINLPSFDVNKLVAHPKTNWEAFSDNQLEMAAIALADYYVKKHGRPKDPDTLGSELAVAHHLVDDQWFTFEHAFANECIESDDE